MSFLSRAFDAIFLTSEQIQLKRAFEQATQALDANDTPALKAVLVNTTFERPEQQSLLLKAITADNVDGFKVVLQGTGTKVSDVLTVTTHIPFVSETLDTPMLPFAISRGSEKVAGFLASHPDTNLQASARITTFCTAAHPSACIFSSRIYTDLPDARTSAQHAGMKDVADIINTRLSNAQNSPQGPAQK